MNYKTMLDAMRTLLDVLTQGQIQYADPFLESDMSDEDVLREAVEKRFNYSETWSCQWGFFYHCGECRTCKKRSSLFTARLGKDATKYMDDLGTKVILPDSI
jgi:7-cyano-7-deazaguanine synthase in queuosine biosynthesis